MTVATWVCWSIASLTRTKYGSGNSSTDAVRGVRHGRSRRLASYHLSSRRAKRWRRSSNIFKQARDCLASRGVDSMFWQALWETASRRVFAVSERVKPAWIESVLSAAGAFPVGESGDDARIG